MNKKRIINLAKQLYIFSNEIKIRENHFYMIKSAYTVIAKTKWEELNIEYQNSFIQKSEIILKILKK